MRIAIHNVRLFLLLSALALGVVIVVMPGAPAYAQADAFGLQEVEDTDLSLSREGDIRVIIARIINVVLGLLGIIALVLIVYGGFVYMTSGGSEEKVLKARKILINATIGLVIIMSAFAIVSFVISRLERATGVHDGVGVGGGGQNCFDLNACNGVAGGNPVDECLEQGNHFVVTSITPSTPGGTATGMTNTVVRALFSQPLDPQTNPRDVLVVTRGDQEIIPLDVHIIGGRVVQALFAEESPGCNQGQDAQTSCLSPGEYEIRVSDDVRDGGGRDVEEENECGVFPKHARFVNDQDIPDEVSPRFDPLIEINGVRANDADQQGIVLAAGNQYPITADIVDRQQRGQENLVADGDMEALGAAGWRSVGAEQAHRKDQAFVFAGAQSMQINGIAGDAAIMPAEPVVLIPGRQYRYQFRYNVIGGQLSTDLSLVGNLRADFEDRRNLFDATNGQWRLFERVFVAPPEAINGIVPVIRARGDVVFVDSVEIIALGGGEQGGVGLAHMQVERVDVGAGDAPDSFEYYTAPRTADSSNGPLEFFYRLTLGQDLSVPSRYRVTLNAVDIDGNTAEQEAHIVVVGPNCQNGVQDEGEVGVDEGGQCLGNGACEFDWQCASRQCVAGQCVAYPMILDVDPWDGASGNFVTVLGRFFGQQAGDISFGQDDNDDGVIQENEWVIANPPAQCQGDMWTDEFAVVTVPSGIAVDEQMPIRLRKAIDAADGEDPFVDTTINNHGPKPGPRRGLFLVNDQKRPGLCEIRKNGVSVGSAFAEDDITAIGSGFGDIVSQLTFGGFQSGISQWNDTNISAEIPRIAPGRVGVQVRLADALSNGLPFTIRDPAERDFDGPRITSVDPQETTPGSLVTVSGQDFGHAVGEVFLANSPEQLAGCAAPDANCIQLTLDLPGACGLQWSDNEIVGQVPLNINLRNYVVGVHTANGDLTAPSDPLSIVAGDPRPGICRIAPNTGPAPLPSEAASLNISGIHFSQGPTVYYSRRGFNPNDTSTWLSSADDRLPAFDQNPLLGPGNTAERIRARIPVDARGNSMATGDGLIRVSSDQNQLSNAVSYSVNDCREADDLLEGFHCCIEGPEAGSWKQNGRACEGEIRDAGYVWRFTTGRIPNIPQVVQACNVGEWFDEDARVAVPSPAPWNEWQQGDNVCVNASVVVRFTPTEMDPATINENAVRLYTCADNNGQPNCFGDNKVRVEEPLDLEYAVPSTLWIYHGARRPLLPDTWYHVELDTSISSLERIQVLGQEQIERYSLRATRSCGDGTAYCFEFKTSAEGRQCDLAAASITPFEYTSHALGMLQDPRFATDENLDDPAHPLYYTLSGRGDQVCLPLYVDGLGWEWSTDGDAAAARVAPENGGRRDTRATISALAHTAPDFVEIRSDLDENDPFGPKRATSDLLVELGDPHVIDFFPNCAESCTNAILGMTFSRPMIQETYRGGFVLRQCLDEFCAELADGVVPVAEVEATQRSYRVRPIQPLEEGVWYIATANGQMLSIGRLVPDGEIIPPGRPLVPFSWKFRTKEIDGECRVESVRMSPDPFTARNIGEKTRYTAIPRSSPDACSPFGQELNPWDYGWAWAGGEGTHGPVADVSTLTSVFGQSPFCSTGCLPLGSDVPFSETQTRLCGNGVVEPGEDCDIAQQQEIPGATCTYACLRPGTDPPLCGNGVLDLAEECDPAQDDPNREDILANCSARCVWRGSSQDEPEGALNQAWCRSGSVTFGEDCDLNISIDDAQQQDDVALNNSAIGCSSQCLHLGTPLSRAWCQIHVNDNEESQRACRGALSVCGNGTLEFGEECEFVRDENGAVVSDSLRVASGDGSQAIQVDDARSICTSQCLLRNICGVADIPTREQGGVYCNGGDDCSDGCHILGASPLYEEPSLCGDGLIGLGEFGMCESDLFAGEQIEPLGENPVQVVTALGEDIDIAGGDIDLSGIQETRITADPVTYERHDGNREPVVEDVTGVGDYALQCGYTEFGSEDLMASRDGNMEMADQILWEQWKEVELHDVILILKTDQQAHSGRRSLGIVVVPGQQAGAVHRGVPVVPGQRYELTFLYKVHGNMTPIISFSSVEQLNEPIGVGDQVYRDDFERANDVLQATQIWQFYRREFVVPLDVTGPMNITFLSLGGAEMVLDNVAVRELQEGVQPASGNDCPDNDNNQNGVAVNSCCYPRPARVAEYPADRSADVCRNTVIQAEFVHENVPIDEETLAGNVRLLVGKENPQFDCATIGGTDVTLEVQETLRLAYGEDNSPGIFRRVWQSVKSFFAGLVRPFVHAQQGIAVDQGPAQVWCDGVIPFQTKLRTVAPQDQANITSYVTLQLGAALDPLTDYAVLLKGGVDGVKNVLGVSIRSQQQVQGSFKNSDTFHFRTGDEICRVSAIQVEPDAFLFREPRFTKEFSTTIESSGGRFIQSIAGVYAWEHSWLPRENPLFDIPSQGPDDSSLIQVGSREVEGSLALVGQLEVTTDISGAPLEAFTDFSQLTAEFCANPWPSAASFPYEDDLYNYAMSYCADAGNARTVNDDLPLVEPLAVAGLGLELKVGDINRDGRVAADDSACYFEAFSNDGDADCIRVSERQADLNCDGSGFGDIADLDLINFRVAEGVWPQQIDGDGNGIPDCRPENNVDQNDSPDLLKRTLFFNGENDDVIGVQIFKNSTQKPLNEWIAGPPVRANPALFDRGQVDGYDALADESNMYVAALNQIDNPVGERDVYHNIYQFSINENAQERTREIFAQLLDTLEFNINIRNFNYCLSNQVPIHGRQIPAQTSFHSELADPVIDCDTDFDCRDSFGVALGGTNGMCSNAKTKFLRDWRRLSDGRAVQQKIEAYRNNEFNAAYPTLAGGTFIPQYTNSQWPSWGVFAQELGAAGLPGDVINQWSLCGLCSETNDRGEPVSCTSDESCQQAGAGETCEAQDARTCWNAQESQFICPQYSSVVEYKNHTPDDYTLHIPLEYFSEDEPIVRGTNDTPGFLDVDHISSQPSCVGGVQDPFGGRCGDGVVNAGESCDPPGKTILGDRGFLSAEPGVCKIQNNRQCSNNADCDRIGGRVIDGKERTIMTNNRGYCEFQFVGIGARLDPGLSEGQNQDVIAYDTKRSQGLFYQGIGCSRNEECSLEATFSGVNTVALLGTQDGQNHFKGKVRDLGRSQYLKPDIYRPVCNADNVKAQQCGGAQPGGAFDQCRINQGEFATWRCNDACQWDFGQCQTERECGNGIVEPGEFCDDGALNGTYGHCAGSDSPGVEACQGVHPQYCGNGFMDQDGGGGNIEFCENVLNFDFTTPGLIINNSPHKARMSVSGMGIDLRQYMGLTREDQNDVINALVNNIVVQCQDAEEPKQFCGNFILVGWLIGDPALDFLRKSENIMGYHCERDQRLLCNPDNGNIDCLSPKPEDTLSLNNFDPNDVSFMRPVNTLVNYGDCVPVIGRFGTTYNTQEEFSCSIDCRGPGEYCGDGFVQVDHDEQCDDGNKNNTDACRNDCTENDAPDLEVADVVHGSCGDGEIQNPNTDGVAEVCDLGDQNGIACQPEYGQACTYCAGDCRNVLTVDRVGFCGNGFIDQTSPGYFIIENGIQRGNPIGVFEQCDIKRDGEQVVVRRPAQDENTQLLDGREVFTNENGQKRYTLAIPAVCPDQGSYQCSQDCQLLTQQCVSCGYTNGQAGPVPTVATLNPISPAGPNQLWGNRLNASVIRHADIGSDGYGDVLLGDDYDNYNRLLESNPVHANVRLASDLACREEYTLVYNGETIAQRTGLNAGESLTREAAAALESSSKLGGFAYPVNGERQEIRNTVIASPAIPFGYIRVVVRWKDTPDDRTLFIPNIYNLNFNSPIARQYGGRIMWSHTGIKKCQEMRLRRDEGRWKDFWWPVENGNCTTGGTALYNHGVARVGDTNAIAMTLDISRNRQGQPYAFFVSALEPGEGLDSISQNQAQDVTVEVYEPVVEQIPEFSLYPPKPWRVYNLNLARPTDNPGLARYWHVFNIVDENGDYRIEQVDGNLRHGLIATDFVDLQCHVPHNPGICRRGE